jgi:hypothetical protein
MLGNKVASLWHTGATQMFHDSDAVNVEHGC